MTILHRLPADLDQPKLRGNLDKCQWCGNNLVPSSYDGGFTREGGIIMTDIVFECVGRLDHYLVCPECHDKAIIH